MEIAVRWVPVKDLPQVTCHTWRLRTDEDFGLMVEGDFLIGRKTSTLSVDFDSVFALAAHDDMGAKTMTSASPLPTIGTGKHADHVFPMMTIENSNWRRRLPAPTEDYVHYLFVSFTCSVEVLARSATASWVH